MMKVTVKIKIQNKFQSLNHQIHQNIYNKNKVSKQN